MTGCTLLSAHAPLPPWLTLQPPVLPSKNRGKRPAKDSADGEGAKKKAATEFTPDSEYARQVAKLSSASLKDEGMGIRPTLK